MVMRRTDARRRRVLSEEFIPTDESVVSGANKPMRAYSFSANRRNQPKTTDLIPKRVLSLCLFFLFTTLCVVTLNILAIYSAELAESIGQSSADAMALSGAGSISNWLCSICLFLCSGVCVQLYLLRQHRRDDYSGMYRVWILMAIMFAIASIDCAVDLRTMAAKVFEILTHRSLIQTPWLTMTIELIVLGLIAVRMLFEVRASKATLAGVTAVWIGFVGCTVVGTVKLPESIAGMDSGLVYGNCMLLGCVGSLATLTIYTRFVFLHAHGLIQVKAKQPKATLEIEADSPKMLKSASSMSGKKKSKQPATAEREETETIEFPRAEDRDAPAAKATGSSRRKRKAANRKAAAAAAAKSPTPSKPVEVAPASAEPEIEKPTRSKSKRKKAVAKANAAKTAVEELDQDNFAEEDAEILSMSKSERRRARKLAKRAARARNAA